MRLVVGLATGIAASASARAQEATPHAPRFDETVAPYSLYGTDGPVNAVVHTPRGDVYIGGRFTRVGGVAANGVARYDASAKQWRSLGPPCAGIDLCTQASPAPLPLAVYALAVVPGSTAAADRVYAGGVFGTHPYAYARNVALYAAGAWQPLAPLGTDPTGPVMSLFVAPGASARQDRVYAGGTRLSLWSQGAWTTLGTGTGPGTNGVVFALRGVPGASAATDRVYAAGTFTRVNVDPAAPAAAVAANWVALWTGTAWQALGTDGGNGVNAPVYALALVPGASATTDRLYLGGAFGGANLGAPATTPALHLALWTGTAWQGGLWPEAAARPVRSLDVDPGGQPETDRLAVAEACAPAAERCRVWERDRGVWETAGQTVGAFERAPGAVVEMLPLMDVHYVRGQLHAGGAYLDLFRSDPAARRSQGFAALDGGEWEPLLDPLVGPDGPVYAIARTPRGDLYVAGAFRWIGRLRAASLARYDPVTERWHALGTGGGGVSGTVRTLALVPGGTASGDRLYVGGRFDTADVGAPVAARNVALWTGTAWQPLGADGGNGADAEVRALAVARGLFPADDRLYAGGLFAAVNAGGAAPVNANRVAAWMQGRWAPLTSGGSGNGVTAPAAILPASVNALALAPGPDARADRLYVGGAFWAVQANGPGERFANNVALWTEGAWQPLTSRTGGNGVGRPDGIGRVDALALHPGPSAAQDRLYVGGDVSLADLGAPSLVAARYVALWSEQAWQALADPYPTSAGPSAPVRALALVPGLNAAGDLLFAGGADRVRAWRAQAWTPIDDPALPGEVHAFARAETAVVAPLYVGGAAAATPSFTFVTGGLAVSRDDDLAPAAGRLVLHVAGSPSARPGVRADGAAGPVQLTLVDLLGRRLATARVAPGETWTLPDDLAAGRYLVHARAGERLATASLAVVR